MNKPFDPTKPVQTRDGRKARIICTDYKGFKPIIAIITTEEDSESVFCYESNGRFTDPTKGELDLINIPERTSSWFNLYEPDLICGSYRSHEVANLRQTSSRLATLELVYEDGKPVNVKLHKDEK